MKKVVGMTLVLLSGVLLLLASINFTLYYDVLEWPTWFAFSTYLRVIGVVCLLAAVAEAIVRRGQGWVLFAFLFASVAYRTLSGESLPADYPTDPDVAFGMVIITAILAFGSGQLLWKAGTWFK